MNHYKWLDKNFWIFVDELGLPKDTQEKLYGIITAHGDKCYSHPFDAYNIPFEHGVALYLLTYIYPWTLESRNTPNGWKDPFEWIVQNYEKFKPYLPKEN